MPRNDDSLERLRAAIDDLAAADAADLLAEARVEARARVRATLTDALAHSMLERLHAQMEEAVPRERPTPPPLSAEATPPVTPNPPPRANPETPPRLTPDPPPPTGSGESAWYVYGVVAADSGLGDALRVDPEQPVTILAEGTLAAVASEVPLDEFDEAQLREHLTDMAWVEATARAHEAVLERVGGHVTVIPMRMCTVYRTEGGVREMLSREAGPLEEALDHLNGKAEWGVKVFTELARAGGRTQHVDAGAGDSPGAEYMERKRTERERRERAAELAEEAVALIHERLSALASDAQSVPLQRREVTGHSGDMVLNGVYLVADEAAAAFHEEVQALRSEFEPQGIVLEPTGPWPAYNFVPATIGAAW